MGVDIPIVRSAGKVGHSGQAIERLPLHKDIPVAIRRRREALKFDYGKFDFIEHQDGPVLIDANRTPNEGPNPEAERVDAICATLADGLAGFLSKC